MNEFHGYVESSTGTGVFALDIISEDGYVTVWWLDISGNHDMGDDIENKEDLASYGNRFYHSLEDYRNDYDTYLTVEDVWPGE
jgi:hypothetical protein